LAKNHEKERIIFELFYEKIYKTAYFMTKDPHMSQDIAQESFIKAFKKIDTIKEPSKISAWLGTIATNTSLDYLRKRNRFNDIAVEEEHIDYITENNSRVSSVERLVELKYLKKTIQENMSLLRPEYKQILILKFEYGLKEKDISRLLGISEGTVKSRYHRAKQQLRVKLEEIVDFKGVEEL